MQLAISNPAFSVIKTNDAGKVTSEAVTFSSVKAALRAQGHQGKDLQALAREKMRELTPAVSGVQSAFVASGAIVKSVREGVRKSGAAFMSVTYETPIDNAEQRALKAKAETDEENVRLRKQVEELLNRKLTAEQAKDKPAKPAKPAKIAELIEA